MVTSNVFRMGYPRGIGGLVLKALGLYDKWPRIAVREDGILIKKVLYPWPELLKAQENAKGLKIWTAEKGIKLIKNTWFSKEDWPRFLNLCKQYIRIVT